MKKFLLATVSMVALASVARAADVPAAMSPKAQIRQFGPTVDWAGGYLGIEVGVASHNATFKDFDCALTDCTFIDRKKLGEIAGGLLGFNFQQGSFVYGVEGDWSWIGGKSSNFTFDVDGVGSTLSTSFDVNWLATFRGRAGLAFDSTLFYITGGAALGHVKNSVTETNVGNVFDSFNQNQTKVGWTAGGGVEHLFTRHWTARAEFRYVDLGKVDVTCTGHRACGSGAYRGEFSNRLMLGLVGVAYKF